MNKKNALKNCCLFFTILLTLSKYGYAEDKKINAILNHINYLSSTKRLLVQDCIEIFDNALE